MIDKAKIGPYNNSGKQGSILQKLLTRCGPDSPVPHLMCQDALTAGVDTTGTTAAFLLLPSSEAQIRYPWYSHWNSHSICQKARPEY